MLDDVSLPGCSSDESDDQGFSKSPEFDESSYQSERGAYLKEDQADIQNMNPIFF